MIMMIQMMVTRSTTKILMMMMATMLYRPQNQKKEKIQWDDVHCLMIKDGNKNSNVLLRTKNGTSLPMCLASTKKIQNLDHGCIIKGSYTRTMNFLKSESIILNQLVLFGTCIIRNGWKCIRDSLRTKNSTSLPMCLKCTKQIQNSDHGFFLKGSSTRTMNFLKSACNF